MKQLSQAEKLQAKALAKYLTSGALTDTAFVYQWRVVQARPAAELQRDADLIRRQMEVRSRNNRHERSQTLEIEW
jgi:hypothetical protein